MSRRSRSWPSGTPCWTDLSTSDPAGAHAFYTALFGWDVQVGPPEFGGYAVAYADGGAAAGIGPKMSEGAPVGWTLYFATDDAAATASEVADAGGRVIVEPMNVPGTGTMLLCTDPVGAMVGAWQSGPFIGAETVNQPGALVWEDLRSSDADASRAFLSAVFGVSHDPLPGLDGYTTMRLDEPFPLGGVGPMFGAATPGWVVYFGVEDIEASLVTAREAGARSVGPVDDTPFGKMAQVTDPQGASFVVSQNTGQPQPDRS